MKKAIVSAVVASSLVACTSVETAVVSGNEISVPGAEPIAVIQGTALGLTAIFHVIDLVQSDLDTVVNKLLVAEAKAMGGNKVHLLTAGTTPRHGIFALTGLIIGFPVSGAVGVAVK
ncbi:hypothetical protein JRI60_05895 [Archangium violaceum]|uniref:hypothetical protein n=1 Tax=Archangium violaceum TaxID=83451 RepID=UPI00194FC83D|nr:hypothetical protein [Archangium violaceum]QRN98574.1 hypothetical protein JRI60_05895 [Archangium violaceum]